MFFDALGLRWEYEHQGYDLNGVYYLPDFWMLDLDGYIEIKPREFGDDWPSDPKIDAWFDLEAEGKAKRLYLICGEPGITDDWYSKSAPYICYILGDYPYVWCECPHCGAIGLQFDGRSARNKHAKGCPVIGSGNDKNYNSDSPRLVRAAEAARSARFEHSAR